MSLTPPEIFPPEIIDLIVDEISNFTDERSRIRTLAASALVSWYFRHRAHTHLFSHVYIHDVPHTPFPTASTRARRFLGLINADPQSETTGIASYIRSLTVNLSGPIHKIRRVIDDGTLAAIFRKIFKTNDDGHRSLSLSFLVRGDVRNAFNWESLDPDFLSAFHDLCRSPCLTTLHLANFVNLPRTLLHHSFIKNVRFSRLQLAGADNEDDGIPATIRTFESEEQAIGALEEGQAVPLESIETDHSLPLLDLIDMTPQHILHPKLAFSQLKTLTAHIGDEEDFHKTRWILANTASNLVALDIILFTTNGLPDPHWRIAIPEMHALRKLSIVQNSSSYKSPGRTTIPQVCTLLNHINLHPQLEEATVKLSLYSQYAARTPLDIFEGHDFSPLDALFSHARFQGLKHLTIQVSFNLYPNQNEQIYLGRFRSEGIVYVRKSFSAVASRAALGQLQFVIHIVPYVRQR